MTQLTVTSRKRKLIEIIRHEKRSTFKVSDLNGVKLLTHLRVNPISTGRGGGGVFHTQFVFPCNFLFLSQFPPNLATFPKI